MSDNPTLEMPNSSSFEERVFARFDAFDARFDRSDARIDRFESRLESKVDALDKRLTALDEKVDTRLRETRPIWEAVQARLEEIEKEVRLIRRTIKALHSDILQVRGEQEELESQSIR
jgi:prefoldin subunit 5